MDCIFRAKKSACNCCMQLVVCSAPDSNRCIYPEGDYYVGEWKNGNRHGLGTYWSEDGDRYNGLHKDGQRHGKGYYYWSDGRIDP